MRITRQTDAAEPSHHVTLPAALPAAIPRRHKSPGLRAYRTSQLCIPSIHNPLFAPAQIEYFCIIVFTIEFFLRICSCSADAGLLRFCVSIMNLVDLLAIVPWWVMSIQTWTNSGSSDSLKALAVLRVLRLTRVVRVFKMSRNFTGLNLLGQTFKKSASALVMLFLFVMMSLVVFATLMFNAESGTWDPVRLQFVRDDGQPSPFESIPRTMWWCIVTMTTVGYGDNTPITVREVRARILSTALSDLETSICPIQPCPHRSALKLSELKQSC